MTTKIDEYMERLRKKRDKMQTDQRPPLTLVQIISDWWENMPDVQRCPCYSMDFLVATFGYASSKIGPALHELGWQRRRSWQPGRPFCRVWVPKTK